MFKVDFEKAYDSVDWGFLEYMLRRLGFNGKWIAWMKACIFRGKMSILVNGSPIEEIDIQRGLKQGDPLAPFLFLVVAEGFSGLMRTAVERNLFHGFRVGQEVVVISHLQYANDTLCIGEASIQNIWTLKAILRGFASGEGVVPFGYLGLPVGANPRSRLTWEPLLDNLRRRLLVWENKFVSLGGRIVLLNSVLNSIPIFYLSFLKMSVKVWKKIVRLQREFLWGGGRGVRKINWVKWNIICQPKSTGGLGVRDVRVVILSLLTKGKWRLLISDQTLWKQVLVGRYGDGILTNPHWGDLSFPSSSSTWWKDIGVLEYHVGSNWFSNEVVRKVNNGGSTRLWKDRNFLARFLEVLEGFRWSEGIDLWGWCPENGGDFSVKSAYVQLAKLILVEDRVTISEERVFKSMWKSSAPSKVIGLAWKLLHDRLPTRRNLAYRNVIPLDVSRDCVLCVGVEESSIHLYLHRDFAAAVWFEVFRWLGLTIIIPPNLFFLAEFLSGAARNRKIRKGYWLIWHTTIWVIWKVRNSIIFEDEDKNLSAVIDAIKVTSWKWRLIRLKVSPCLFYEWSWDPRDCLAR
ncbi:hypothetical protein TSUD_60610 [Trifolium subterraneum]|uniref:Reverse transcriptase domain-containing protein n=1 Tax=Trifolium subterraneum TaxID=3900 RepID=A0A2Z6NU28_TRISU|nr:hypothetical protein TSUD_60610 [Trifolium subterraneum]